MPSPSSRPTDFAVLASKWRPLVAQIISANRGVLLSQRLREAVTKNSYAEARIALQAMAPRSHGQATSPVIDAINGLLEIMEEVKQGTDGSEDDANRAFAELKDAVLKS